MNPTSFSNKKVVMLLTAFLLCLSFTLFAQANDFNYYGNGVYVNSGIGVGSIIAIVASWSRNKSVLWAIFHAFCGWAYVIYYIITR